MCVCVCTRAHARACACALAQAHTRVCLYVSDRVRVCLKVCGWQAENYETTKQQTERTNTHRDILVGSSGSLMTLQLNLSPVSLLPPDCGVVWCGVFLSAAATAVACVCIMMFVPPAIGR